MTYTVKVKLEVTVVSLALNTTTSIQIIFLPPEYFQPRLWEGGGLPNYYYSIIIYNTE